MSSPLRHKLLAGFAPSLVLFLCLAASPEVSAQRRPGRGAQASAAAARERNNPPSPHVAEAQRHAEAGNWAEAIKSYRLAVSANPKDGEAHVGLGDAYMSAGKYEEAFASYREAVRVAPWNPEAHYSLGAAYNDMAQYGDSFKHFVQAIRLDAGYAEAHYGIGYAYQNLENYREALGYLKSALRLRPDYPEARLSLGRTYLGLGNVRAAEEELRALEGADAALAKELDREIQKAAGAARVARQASPPAPSPAPPRARENQSQRETTQAEKERPAPSPAAKAQPSPRPGRAGANPASNNADNFASPLAVELSFWDSIKNSSDPEEFAAYLGKYPEGQFSELARIRLRSLGNRKAVGAETGAAPKGEAPEPEVAAVRPAPEPTPEPTPRPTPAPPPAPAPTPPAEPAGDATLEDTLDWLRKNFAANFRYKYTTAGETAGGAATTGEAEIIYEPVRFEGCDLEWRDGPDTLSVSLSELDALNIKVGPRERANTTFAVEVWNVNLPAAGGKLAFREVKGDGSGETNTYSGINLQFDDRQKAERMARVLRHAAKLCAGRSFVAEARP